MLMELKDAMKTILKAFVGYLVCVSFLSGCASNFIDKKAGSESILVVDASKVSSCELKSKVTSSVLAKLWFVSRSQESVEENLLEMARNAAVDDGADTIVKGYSTNFGERTFDLYKCRH